MPWFKFDEDFNHRTGRMSFKQYRAGTVALVTTACAKDAETAGAGKRTKKPKDGADEAPEAEAQTEAEAERVNLQDSAGDGQGS